MEEDEDFMDFGKVDMNIGAKLRIYERLFNDGDITEEVFDRIAKELRTGQRDE